MKFFFTLYIICTIGKFLIPITTGNFNKKEKTSGVPIRNDQSQCNLLHHLILSPFAIKINPISFLVTKKKTVSLKICGPKLQHFTVYLGGFPYDTFIHMIGYLQANGNGMNFKDLRHECVFQGSEKAVCIRCINKLNSRFKNLITFQFSVLQMVILEPLEYTVSPNRLYSVSN